MKNIFYLLSSIFYLLSSSAAEPPNVIIIITDDQGYGDLACHGNPVIKTPQLDQLHAESIRFTDFHVSPFCTPTRAALMTGRYPARTGAFRTSSGRSNLHADELTIAQHFAKAGYSTGMIGKWHLGDNAPCRPQDKGFQDVLWHKCGGIGQASDYYGNDYFDDTYERSLDGKVSQEKFKGYCTDVFFDESLRFVQDNQDKPFLLYVSTNAPHSPYRVGKQWSEPYRDSVKWKWGAEFYGMITNFDHNVGRLRNKLNELNIADNTILIFMTDNGTAKGNGGKGLVEGDFRGFTAGMRGMKSTLFEGGHRVPFFIHWPAGGLTGGKDRAQLTAHLDVLPTLAELCQVPTGDTFLDGKSFLPVLRDPAAPACRDHVVVQFHGGPWMQAEPMPYAFSNVIKGPWRLHNGEVLHNVGNAHWEGADVAKEHPEVVAELRALYDTFWKSVSPRMTPVCLDLGNPAQNPTELCSQDWRLTTGNPPWNYGEINQLKKITGPWHVNVVKAGTYKFTLRQFPEVANKPLVALKAKLQIAGIEKEAPVKQGAKEATFTLELPAGKTTLTTWLTNDKGETGGAYFTEVELLNAAAPAAPSTPTSSTPARADWLDQDKFGLFIHWGLYSQIAKGEWYMHSRKVPIEEYSKLAETCNPTKFSATEWVKIAKDAGMKYIVITSKHHDGFALFDSQVSNYNIVDATPFKRDMIAELKAACDAQGIKLGLYYSHAQDWYHRGGSHHYNWKNPSGMDEMQHYLNNISLPQVKEILTQYQPAIIWYDTPRRMTPALAEPFSKLVREISPSTLINSRIALDGNKMDKVSQKDLDMLKSLDTDYISYADREIPANSPWKHWETCMTLNGSWGFTKGDNAWKTPSHVIQQLLEVVSKNGAFLLNVGPTAEGEFPAESVTVLKQVGDWLKLNGDAVYGAQPVSFNLPGTPTAESLKRKADKEARFAKLKRDAPHTSLERDFPWLATRKGDTIHLTIFDWPTDNTLTIAKVSQDIKNIQDIESIHLATESGKPLKPLKHSLSDGTLTISLPTKPAGNLPPVLRLRLIAAQRR